MSAKLWMAAIVMILLPVAGIGSPIERTAGGVRKGAAGVRGPENPVPMETAEQLGSASAAVLQRAALRSSDNVGGDDKIIFSDPDIATRHSYCMDVAENGDIYVAVERNDPVEGAEILVLRSQDGGDSWATWGSRSDANATRNYHQPSLHIAEGDQNLLYLAYQYENGAADRIINVAYSSMNIPSAVWTLHTAMSEAGVDFQYPNLSSDEMNFSAYRLYLAAEGDDSNGNDIWFSRSATYGASWEPKYTIATLSAGDRNYSSPEVRYGRGGTVHCVWQFAIDGNSDTAIRYRRALNYASVAADWQPVVQITSTTDGRQDENPSVAASHWSDNILIGYLDIPANVSESQLRLSTDAGASWPSASTVDLAMGAWGPELLALPGGQGFRVCGYWWTPDTDGRVGFYSSTEAAPLALSPEQIFEDDLHGSGLGDPTVAMDYDASRGNRLAFVWGIDALVGSDNLYFDAEWRSDPGYPNLEENFPHALSAGAVASPALVDLDGDADLEIVFGDATGAIQVFNPDASAVPGWPVDIGDFPPTYPAAGGYPTANSTVAVDDLDGDGSPEVVAGNADGQVCVYRSDGTPMPGWPLSLGAGQDVFVSIGSIAFGWRRQIVACAGTQVHLLRPDATEAPGFPVTVAYDLTAPAAIGDLDANGEVDLVVVGGRDLNWFDRDGHWHMRQTLVEGHFYNGQVSLGDVDLNGDLEIAYGTSFGRLVVMHHDVPEYLWSYLDPSESYITSPALANVIGTFQPDVAFAARSWNVHLFLSTGTEAAGWPHETGASYYLLGSPIMDTLDEGSPDVIIGSRDGNGYAWNNLFTNVPGWPKELPGQCNTSPASGDIDQDGRLEVVLATSTRLIALDTGAQVQHSDPRGQWPMYGFNPARTACLACPEDAASGVANGGVPRSSPLRLASSNPTRSSARLQFRLEAAAAVRLTIYDVSGRAVRELLRDELPAGSHDLLWDGRDAPGREVPSGTYFCRLQAGATESMQRVVIVR